VLYLRFDRGAFRRACRFLATPPRDERARAETRLATFPDDALALRELGRAYLAGDAPDRALPLLDRAAVADPEAPETRFLLGATHLRLGDPREASAALRTAGQLLEAQPEARPELVHEVTLGLAAARLALGDPEGAVLTAEEATVLRPRDPRGVLLTADALLAAGRLGEAEARLERAAAGAGGARGELLSSRLGALRKRIRKGRGRRRGS